MLAFSFCENKPAAKEANKIELVAGSKADTLKFTSGIRAILQDSKGNYWFGSHNEGVGFYNGESFKYFTTNDGLSHNQIRSIQEDESGRIWFATAKGVSVYDKGSFTRFMTSTNKPVLDWNATKGGLWFYANEEDGINRFDGMNMSYLVFPKPKNHSSDRSYGVTGISIDKDGKLWISTYSALFSYDGGMVHVFDNKSLKLKDDDNLHIRSVLADSKGRIWIGNNGIGVILKKGNSITHFSKEQGKLIPADEFAANTQSKQFAKNTGLQAVFVITEDSQGNIWFGDRDSGAWKYDGITLTNYKINTKSSSQMISCIYEDQDKNLLFGMADGKVLEFNGSGFERHF